MPTMLALMVCAACAVAFAFVAVRHPVVAIAIVLGAWVASFGIRDPLDLSLTISTTRVFLLDVLAAVFLVVATVRALIQNRWDLGRILVFALVALLVIHTGRGVVEFGLQTGFNSARTWMYFVAALAYVATLREFPGEALWRLLIVTGLVLAAIAVPYFFIDGVKSASGQIVHNGELVNWRPITAAGALMVLQAGILLVGLRWPSRGGALSLAGVLAVILLLLQHRTIWVAGVVVLVIAGAWWIVDHPERRRLAIGAIVAAAAALAIFVGAAAIAGGAFWDSIKEPASEQSTLIWRTDGWSALVRANDDPSQVLTGNPSGRGFERLSGSSATNSQAHNQYVDAYVRFGVVGTVIAACLWVLLFVRWRRVGTGSALGGRLVLLLLVTQVAFSLTYALDVSQGIVGGALVCGLGLAAAVSAPAPPQREPSQRPQAATAS